MPPSEDRVGKTAHLRPSLPGVSSPFLSSPGVGWSLPCPCATARQLLARIVAISRSATNFPFSGERILPEVPADVPRDAPRPCRSPGVAPLTSFSASFCLAALRSHPKESFLAGRASAVPGGSLSHLLPSSIPARRPSALCSARLVGCFPAPGENSRVCL